MYDAEISRSQPTTYLFLVDQSGSMSDQMGSSQRSKAQFVADVLNKTLRDLVVRCTRDEGVRDYFSVGVLGYGAPVLLMDLVVHLVLIGLTQLAQFQ